MAQKGVMDGVRAWRLWERWMPPPQCRVNWSLQSSQEGQGVTLPFLNLKSSPGGSHFISQECFGFSFSGGVGVGRGIEKSFLVDDRSLNPGPFTSWLSATASKVPLVFRNHFLIWEMKNRLKRVPKLSFSVNFP